MDPYLIIIPFPQLLCSCLKYFLIIIISRFNTLTAGFTSLNCLLKQSAEYTSSSETDYDNGMNKVARISWDFILELLQIKTYKKFSRRKSETDWRAYCEYKEFNDETVWHDHEIDLRSLKFRNSNAKLYLLEAENNSELCACNI